MQVVQNNKLLHEEQSPLNPRLQSTAQVIVKVLITYPLIQLEQTPGDRQLLQVESHWGAQVRPPFVRLYPRVQIEQDWPLHRPQKLTEHVEEMQRPVAVFTIYPGWQRKQLALPAHWAQLLIPQVTSTQLWLPVARVKVPEQVVQTVLEQLIHPIP